MEIEKLGQQLVARLKTACTAFFPQTMSNYIIANISYASLRIQLLRPRNHPKGQKGY